MRTPAEDLAKFNDSVSILVKAYLNGTLLHGDCRACAVGNMVAHKMGIKITIEEDDYENCYASWDVGEASWYNHVFLGKVDAVISRNAMRQYKAIGYTAHQVARIEHAFEDAKVRTYGPIPNMVKYNDDEWMFNGLMDVVDVLADIHNIDLSVRENAKALFVKP